MTNPPWSPHRHAPEAERWRGTQETIDSLRKTIETLEAERDAEKTKRRAVETQAALDADKWRKAVRQIEIERDAADRHAKDIAVNSMINVHDAKWIHTQDTTDHQDRIRSLERQLQEERSAHIEELQRHAKMVHGVQADADKRLEDMRQRCDLKVAAAVRLAREAEESAAAAQRRADEQVAHARKREELRVQEVRKMAEERVRETDEHRQKTVEILHKETTEQKQRIEEQLRAVEKQKSAATNSASRHCAALEREATKWRETQEADFEMKDARLREFKASQELQNRVVAQHHKTLLDAEKLAHGRTMERTMNRVMRQAKGADGSLMRAVDPEDSQPPVSVSARLAAGRSLRSSDLASPLALAGRGAAAGTGRTRLMGDW
mmetsp:Transcript_47903/g.95282  ORF Transcript_47903/g.95282 Transcript_47903/m.95282 type:complete len:379 (-) Transcript_47903:86-1222(-)